MHKPNNFNKSSSIPYFCPLLCVCSSDIKSGSSFRVTVYASQVLMSAKNLACRYSPFFFCKCCLHSLDSFIPCLNDWDDICGTKCRLKCPRIFLFYFLNDRKQQTKMLTTGYSASDCHVCSPPASLPDHCYHQ